jgi:hypothetical protein
MDVLHTQRRQMEVMEVGGSEHGGEWGGKQTGEHLHGKLSERQVVQAQASRAASSAVELLS